MNSVSVYDAGGWGNAPDCAPLNQRWLTSLVPTSIIRPCYLITSTISDIRMGHTPFDSSGRRSRPLQPARARRAVRRVQAPSSSSSPPLLERGSGLRNGGFFFASALFAFSCFLLSVLLSLLLEFLFTSAFLGQMPSPPPRMLLVQPRLLPTRGRGVSSPGSGSARPQLASSRWNSR